MMLMKRWMVIFWSNFDPSDQKTWCFWRKNLILLMRKAIHLKTMCCDMHHFNKQRVLLNIKENSMNGRRAPIDIPHRKHSWKSLGIYKTDWIHYIWTQHTISFRFFFASPLVTNQLALWMSIQENVHTPS